MQTTAWTLPQSKRICTKHEAHLTGANGHEVHHALNSGDHDHTAKNKVNNTIKHLDHHVFDDNSKSKHEVHAHKYVHEDDVKHLKPGDTIHHKSYLTAHTHTSSGVPERHKTLHIRAPKGTKAVNVEHIATKQTKQSHNTRENVAFARGAKLKVVHHDKDHIYAELHHDD